MSDSLVAAYILHLRPFRDQRQLAEVFTAAGGRQGAVIRRSRRRAGPQPFHPLWLACGGRGELLSVRRWESRGAAVWLGERALLSGLYLNELLCRLLHRDEPQPALYAAYERSVAELAAGGDLEWILRRFELLLLEELGFGIDFAIDATGAPLEAGRRYRFQADAGLLATTGAEGVPGADLLDFVRGHMGEGPRRALKQVCRQALAPHLGARPLLSRQLFPPSGG